MGQRPVDLLVGGRIDVVVHHEHVLVAVLRGAVAPQRGGDLLGLALVGLADLHHDVHPVRDRVDVDVANAGDAGGLEDVPGDAGPLHGRHHAVLAVGAGQRALEAAAEDRIPPVRDARDLHGRPRRRHVREMAGVLAERALQLPRGRIVVDHALDDDLGRGGHLEIDRLALHQLGRLASIGPHHVPLAHARRNW